MIELQTLCNELDLDAERAEADLTRARRTSDSASELPWYVRLVVGIGAWFTALAAIGLGVAILYAMLDLDSAGALAVLGIMYFTAGVLLLRQKAGGAYLTQLGVAIASAGVAMTAAGVGVEAEELWVAAAVSAAITAVVIVITTDRLLQFLSALLTAVLFAVTLAEEQVPYYLDIVSLAGVAGVMMYLRPLRRDLQPLATVLLLAFPILGIFSSEFIGWMFTPADGGGLFAKGLHIALFLWLVDIHRRHLSTPDLQQPLLIFTIAACLVCLLLPPGGSAALVIMMLAFVLGSAPLALLGTLLQIHYIIRFYYDLDTTLLAKSGMLTATGIVLIAAWWMLHRSREGART